MDINLEIGAVLGETIFWGLIIVTVGKAIVTKIIRG